MPTIPIVVVSSSTPDGTALARIRRRLARMLGPHGVYTTTSQSAIGEARRQVISSRIASSMPGVGHFNDLYLYVVDGAQGEQGGQPGAQRQIVTDQYAGPRLGSVLVDEPYSAALASGVTFEVSIAPAITYLNLIGLNECIVEAAENLPIFHDIDVVAVDQQVRYAITGAPAMLRRDQVVGVYPPISSGSTAAKTIPRPINHASWDVEYDGESPYLVLNSGFTAGDTFFVRIQRTAASWIKSAGTWGASTTGPTLSTDEVPYYSDQYLANLAFPKACERLAAYWRWMGQGERADAFEREMEKSRGVAGLANWYGRLRGDGAQRVGAR